MTPVRAPRRRRHRRLGTPAAAAWARCRAGAGRSGRAASARARTGPCSGAKFAGQCRTSTSSRAAAARQRRRARRAPSDAGSRRGGAAQDHGVVGEVAPEAVPDGGRLAVDEGRDAQVVALRADRGEQLAGIRLAAAATRRGRGTAGPARGARYPSAAADDAPVPRCAAASGGDARRGLRIGRVERGRKRGGEGAAARCAGSPARRGGGAASRGALRSTAACARSFARSHPPRGGDAGAASSKASRPGASSASSGAG